MAGKKLSRDSLQTAEAVLGVGLVVVKELQERSIVTVFVNEDGEVEICPPGEHTLDVLSQEDALNTLLDRNYSDEQLMAYIRGRTTRLRLTRHKEV